MISGLEYVDTHGYPDLTKDSCDPPTPSSFNSATNAVWSDTSSQSSDDSIVSNGENTIRSEKITIPETHSSLIARPTANTANVPSNQRWNSRRTACTAGLVCPPALLRQSDRKVNFVDSLVDTSANLVETIWPPTSIRYGTDLGNKGILPIRTFIQETLRRSRTSYSTLQVALYYLILIKSHVPKHDPLSEEPGRDTHTYRVLQCGRRMFLAALILASKYLQDRNYSARAWSKISGLKTHEINQNEMAFLLTINWKLHITDVIFHRWSALVIKYTPSSLPAPESFAYDLVDHVAEWKAIISRLTPELDGIGSADSCSVACTSESQASPVSRVRVKNEFAQYNTFASTAQTLEPLPSNPQYQQGTLLHTYGPYPTPRLTPTNSLARIPAANSNSCVDSSSISFATKVGFNLNEYNGKWTEVRAAKANPPRQSFLNRTSSALSAYSQMSSFSPESMVSDISFSSSVSSNPSRLYSCAQAPSAMLAPTAIHERQARFADVHEQETIPTSWNTGTDFVSIPATTHLSPPHYGDKVASCYLTELWKDIDAAQTLQQLRSTDVPRATKRNLSDIMREDSAYSLSQNRWVCKVSAWQPNFPIKHNVNPVESNKRGCYSKDDTVS